MLHLSQIESLGCFQGELVKSITETATDILIENKDGRQIKVTLTNPEQIVEIPVVTKKAKTPSLFSVYKRWIDEARIYTSCETGDYVFIGTRKSRSEGGGKLYCFKNREFLWAFEPTDREECISIMCGKVHLTAFPYRIKASPDGSFVAFSFLSYFYLLNSDGQLLVKYHTSELLKAISSDKLIDLPDNSSEDEIDEDDEDEPSVVITRDQYIGSIEFAPDASFCLIAIKNNVFWLTMDGKIVHTQSLTIGGISDFKIFEGGSLVLLTVNGKWDSVLGRVADFTFCLLVDRQEKNIYNTEDRISFENVAYNNALCIFAIAKDDEIKLLNRNLQFMTSLKMKCSIDKIAFSNSGNYLIVSGRIGEVLKLITSKEPVKYIPFKPMSCDIPGVVCKGPEGELLWRIEHNSEDCYYLDHFLSHDGQEIVIAIEKDGKFYFKTYVIGKLINSELKRKGSVIIKPLQNEKQTLTVNKCKLKAQTGIKINFTFETNARICSAQLSPSCKFAVLSAGVYTLVLDSQGTMLRKIRCNTDMVFINDLGQVLAFSTKEITGIGELVTFTKSFFYDIHDSIVQQGNLVAFLTKDSSTDFIWVIDFDGNILMKSPVSNKKSQYDLNIEWASNAPVILCYDESGEFFTAVKVLNV
ncbi:MAG: hypothetical protein ACYC54_07680 [Sedimentisphaerales bacterium]